MFQFSNRNDKTFCVATTNITVFVAVYKSNQIITMNYMSNVMFLLEKTKVFCFTIVIPTAVIAGPVIEICFLNKYIASLIASYIVFYFKRSLFIIFRENKIYIVILIRRIIGYVRNNVPFFNQGGPHKLLPVLTLGERKRKITHNSFPPVR